MPDTDQPVVADRVRDPTWTSPFIIAGLLSEIGVIILAHGMGPRINLGALLLWLGGIISVGTILHRQEKSNG